MIIQISYLFLFHIYRVQQYPQWYFSESFIIFWTHLESCVLLDVYLKNTNLRDAITQIFTATIMSTIKRSKKYFPTTKVWYLISSLIFKRVITFLHGQIDLFQIMHLYMMLNFCMTLSNWKERRTSINVSSLVFMIQLNYLSLLSRNLHSFCRR